MKRRSEGESSTRTGPDTREIEEAKGSLVPLGNLLVL